MIRNILHDLAAEKVTPDDAVRAGFVDAPIIGTFRPNLDDWCEGTGAEARCLRRGHALSRSAEQLPGLLISQVSPNERCASTVAAAPEADKDATFLRRDPRSLGLNFPLLGQVKDVATGRHGSAEKARHRRMTGNERCYPDLRPQAAIMGLPAMQHPREPSLEGAIRRHREGNDQDGPGLVVDELAQSLPE
jgi:hypothetical protein